MNSAAYTALLFFFSLAWLPVHAGALSKDGWTTSACGEKPAPPDLSFESPQAFNQTLELSNQWQQQSAAYFDCIAKEAEDDMKRINDALKSLQKAHNDQVKYYGEQAQAFKQQLQAARQPPVEQ